MPLFNCLFLGNVQDSELEQIHDRYLNCLKTFIEYNFPQEPNRVQDLLVKLPEVDMNNMNDNSQDLIRNILGSRSSRIVVGI